MEAITDQQLDDWETFGRMSDLEEMVWLVDEVRRLRWQVAELERQAEENEAADRRLAARLKKALAEGQHG